MAVMVEIPPMQDFAGFERETERELAGLKGNGADTAAPAPLPPRTDENVHVADFSAGAKKLNGSGSNELVTENQAGLRFDSPPFRTPSLLPYNQKMVRMDGRYLESKRDSARLPLCKRACPRDCRQRGR
jgi:hypothetical protein